MILIGHRHLMVILFQHHLDLLTTQEPSYLDKQTTHGVWIWFIVVLTLMTRVYKDSFSLAYLPSIDVWLVLQSRYPRGGYLMLCWCQLLIPMHSYVYSIPTVHTNISPNMCLSNFLVSMALFFTNVKYWPVFCSTQCKI